MKRYHWIRVLLVLGLTISLTCFVSAALAGEPADPYDDSGSPPPSGDPWFDTYGDGDDDPEGDPGDLTDGLGFMGDLRLTSGDPGFLGADESDPGWLETYLLMLVALMQVSP